MTTEQIQAFTGFGTMIGLIIVGIMNRLDARKAATIAGNIHTLVNSNMGVQLRVNWLQARRIADMTKLPSDIQLADEAEKLYNDHIFKQASIDSQNKPKT
jgi:hypothetical protein